MAMECLSSPTPEQLALALAIVKLKPVGLGVKEYILQARHVIKNSRDAEICHSPEKFFDSIAFWKQAYEKSEAEQSRLLDLIYELEQRNETLLAKSQTKDTLAEVKVQEPSKRKATRNQGGGKRAKTQLHPATQSSAVNNIQAFYHDAIGHMRSIGESTGPFMRNFFILQKVLQKRQNNSSIGQASITLCKTSADEVEGAIPQESLNIGKGKARKGALTRAQLSHLEQVLHGIEFAVNLLLQASKKLSGTEDSPRDANLVTYHIVCLYETIMRTLERYCQARSSQTAAKSEAKTKFSMQTRTVKSKRTNTCAETDTQSQDGDEGAINLVSLLNRMITFLDLTCRAHQDLLEAFLYALLSRVGKFLSIFVFQDLQLRPDLRMDSAELSLPAGLVDVDLDDWSLRAAQMEARYLIWLLERALAVLDECTFKSDAAASEDLSNKAQFVSKIQERLQSTLAQAVFGANPDFGRHLDRPVQPDDLVSDRSLSGHQSPELSVPEWFTQEVWRLLGWEVLMKSKLS